MKQGLIYVSVFLVSCLGARYVGMSEPMSDLAIPEQLPERGLGLFRNATDFRQETWVEELAALPESGAPGFEHLREPMQGLAQAEWVGRSLETGVEAFLQRVLESSWSTKLRRAVAKQARHAYPYAYLSDGVALDAGKHQVKLVLALLKQLTGGDEVAMRALVRRYKLDALVPGLLVAMNPLASLAAANAVTTPGERARRMQEAYEIWTQSDAAASWLHALDHVEGPERRRLLSTIYSTGKQYDIAGTFSMWESILEELPGHDEEMLVRLATSYALKDPEALRE